VTNKFSKLGEETLLKSPSKEESKNLIEHYQKVLSSVFSD